METVRIYKGKDVDMLTTTSIIMENAIANQDYLIEKRSVWASPFFNNLRERIKQSTINFLGIDSAGNQRKATQLVLKIQAEALNDLAELKVQIQEDFKNDKQKRDEILKELGYTEFHKRAQAKDQEALVQFLYQFGTNLSDDLANEIEERGIDRGILERISSYSNELSAANVTQETLKGTRKVITQEALVEFNAIYNEVISIAKIAHNFYKGNAVMQDMFSYSKIHSKLNAFPRPEKEEEDEI
jgi:hypothetical protein